MNVSDVNRGTSFGQNLQDRHQGDPAALQQDHRKPDTKQEDLQPKEAGAQEVGENAVGNECYCDDLQNCEDENETADNQVEFVAKSVSHSLLSLSLSSFGSLSCLSARHSHNTRSLNIWSHGSSCSFLAMRPHPVEGLNDDDQNDQVIPAHEVFEKANLLGSQAEYMHGAIVAV